MPASSLVENTSSESLAEENAFLPKSAPRRVLVYVESDEDIAFWRHVLHAYESPELEFDIQTPTKKGKQKAIEKSKEILALSVGQYLIVCVDSDYDYLLPEHSDTSKLVNENPFIFQTYSYSIENLQCFSDSLHAICVQATKHDSRVIDFKETMQTISEIVYPLLLWNLWFRSQNDHETFTVSHFCEIIKLTDKIDITDQLSGTIDGFRKRIAAKIAALETGYPLANEEIRTIATSLKAKGLEPQNSYLFIQGHTLKDNIVLMLLKPVSHALIKEKESSITEQNTGNKPNLINEMNHYRNQKQDVAIVLNSNTEFRSCFLYKKIKIDLDRYTTTLTRQ